MAGPWEAYQQQMPAVGPWAAYGPAPEATEPAQPLRRGESVATGLGDPLHGGAQFLAHVLPGGVVEGVNNATAWVNRQPVVGPVTRALGMTPATPAQIDQRIQQRETDYQARRAAGGETGFDWGRLGGNVSAALPAAAALPAGSGLMGAAAIGAGSNALMSLAEPVTAPGNYWETKKEQAEMGAVTGVVGGAAGRLLGRLISPNVSPQVRALDEAGVSLTPGQITGGMLRRVEDGSTSLPVVGDAVRGAQRRGVESFNRAVANEVLEPLGASVARDAPVGRALVNSVDDQISAAFNRSLARVRPFGPDQQFATDLARIGQDFLTPESQGTFARLLQDRVVSRFQGGALDGETFKKIDRELGTAARLYGASTEPRFQELARSLRGVQGAMRDLLARSNPDVAPDITAANAAFARFVRMEAAAAGQGATEGVFSPAQLSGAVRGADRSVRHGGYARGDAVLQELSDAGRAVMPSTVPDSGTPFRAALGMGAAGASGLLDPLTAGVGVGMLGAYTTPAQRAIQEALLWQRPLPLRALGNTIANAPLAGAVASGLLAP